MDSECDQRLDSAESVEIFASLTDIVSQNSDDIESLNIAIHIAEDVLAEAPSDLCIPASVFKNLTVRYHRRYQQTQDLDDLQAAITWAEQGAAETPREIDQVVCLSNLISGLVSRYEQTGELEDLHEATVRVDEIPDDHDLPLYPNSTPDIVNIFNTIERLDMVYNASPLASLDSISDTISDLASADSDDPDYLDNAILLAENVLATAPEGHAIQAVCFDYLDKMLTKRYYRFGNLDDLQKAITFLELAVAATPPNDLDRAGAIINLSTRLSERFHRTGDLDELQLAILQTEGALAMLRSIEYE
jgi:hypothetical protein